MPGTLDAPGPSVRLWIAEKPSLAKAIATTLEPSAKRGATHYTLASGDIVTWCRGHMLEQAEPDHYLNTDRWSLDPLPVIPERWVLVPRSDAKQQLRAIVDLMKAATSIVHAGDPDVEGQRIVDSIAEHFGIRKRMQRVLITDVNPPEVRAAIRAMRSNDEPEFRGWNAAAEARACIDWLIGMNLTRAATLKARENGHSGLMPVGRVKAPVLGIVVRRDLSIENFVPTPFFTITAPCTTAAGVGFGAKWRPVGDHPAATADGRLSDRGAADGIARELSNAQGVVEASTATPVVQSPPLLYSLNKLLQNMSKQHGYSAKATNEAMQSLYEAGFLTYPRTSYQHASMARFGDAPDQLRRIAAKCSTLRRWIDVADTSKPSPTFTDDPKKVGSKHAILPTASVPDLDQLPAIERDVYLAVALRYVIQFLPPLRYLQQSIVIRVGNHRLHASGRVITDPGYTAAFAAEPDSEDESPEASQALPKLPQGEAVRVAAVSPASAMTRPPPRFTEHSLLAAMENAHEFVTDPALRARLREGDGIGTDATREGTLSELFATGMLDRDKKNIVSTPAARTLVAALPPILTDPALTAILEQGLDRVAALEVSCTAFVQKNIPLITKLVSLVKSTQIVVPIDPALKCPACGEGVLRKRKGANGAFWGCSRFRDGCTHTAPDVKGRPGNPNAPRKAAASKPSKPRRKSP
jgi:DNA topoisomerase-3